MKALIEDHNADYDTDYTQDLYIANMNFLGALTKEVDKDRSSTDADCKKAYKEGSFIGTIACHADRVLGICSTFHASSPNTNISCPLPGGRVDHKLNQKMQPGRSFCS